MVLIFGEEDWLYSMYWAAASPRENITSAEAMFVLNG